MYSLEIINALNNPKVFKCVVCEKTYLNERPKKCRKCGQEDDDYYELEQINRKYHEPYINRCLN